MSHHSRSPWVALAALAAAACAHAAGSFTWIDDYDLPPRQVATDYVIAPGDLISVRVYNQEGMSARVKVRADGKVSLPFLNDVQAAGVTPRGLAERVQARLKDFVVNPIVTVALEEPKPFEVYVVGEVGKSGRYVLEPGASVLQAIAAAGGLSDFARRDGIFVVRQDPAPVRIRFRYEALTRLEGKAAAFRLRPGDSVVVE